MAHFRATIEGNRGPASRLGSKSSGIHSTTNGWNGGVRVVGSNAGGDVGVDRFDIFATKGSGGGNADGFLGSVIDGKFTPSDTLRARILREYREASWAPSNHAEAVAAGEGEHG